MNQLRHKVLKKCSVCGEFDMIRICEDICDECQEKERQKNKSILEVEQ